MDTQVRISLSQMLNENLHKHDKRVINEAKTKTITVLFKDWIKWYNGGSSKFDAEEAEYIWEDDDELQKLFKTAKEFCKKLNSYRDQNVKIEITEYEGDYSNIITLPDGLVLPEISTIASYPHKY